MPAARGEYGGGGGRKKVKVRAPAFKPLPKTTKPFAPAQAQARKKVIRATRPIEKNVRVAHIAHPYHLTPSQVTARNHIIARTLHDQGVTTTEDVAALPKAARRRVKFATNSAQGRTHAALALLAHSRGYTGSQNELAAVGHRMLAHDYIKGGDLHKRIGLPFGTIDLTPALGAITSHLKGNPISATIKGVQELGNWGAKHGGIIGRAANDALDLPANTVSSLYYVGKQAATGHPLKAGEALVDPIIQTVEHPVKSFTEHPLNTVLIGRGIKGAIGHGAGFTMRHVPIDGVRRVASTEREAKVIPGTGRVIRRQYSKDVISKAGQAALDRRARAKRVKRGENPRPVASKRDIQRAVDEDVQAAKIVTQHNQSQTAGRARDAVAPKKGRGPRRRVKPTAATTLHAQGVVDTTAADLAKYLDEVRAKAPKLRGKTLEANKRTQALLEDAIKNHDPVAVHEAATAYTDLMGELEHQVVYDRGLVSPMAAEESRLAGARARKVKRGSNPPTAGARKAANKALKLTRREADRAKAELDMAMTEARAANTGRGVPPAQHDRLLRAIDRNDRAQQALQVAKQTAHDARSAHTRAHLPAGIEPAYVSHQAIRVHSPALPTKLPEPPVKIRKTGQAIKQGSADVHPAKLIEQAVDTQRLIDSSRAREQFIHDWGYRKPGRTTPEPFASSTGAKNFAEKELGGDWAAVRHPNGEYSLIPKTAWDRLKAHESKVDAQHPLLRGAGAQWRRNVLAFSPRWFFGNMLEAGLRSVIAHAGPTSYLSAKRYLKNMPEDLRQQLEARTTGGGNYTQAARIVEHSHIRRTGEDLGRMARALHALRHTPGPKQLADLYGAYTNIVFRSLNGRLETQFQTAMLGKALRDHPLMSRRVLTLSKEAVREAAEGLRNTDVQAELGRLVDDMYGRYGKFSPGLQGAIANYTPFIAWTLNATNFLFRVLPRDHPVLTGLLASANVASEKWRREHKLFLDFFSSKRSAPGWLLGSIPGKGDSHLRLSRYTPFGLLDNEGAPIIGQLEGLLLPQLNEMNLNANGKDWMDKPLSDNPSGARDTIAAVASFIEGQVPAASLVTGIAGIKLPNQRDSQKTEPTAWERAQKALLPLEYTKSKPPSSSSSRKVRAPSIDWGSSGSNVDWGDSSSSVDWGNG